MSGAAPPNELTATAAAARIRAGSLTSEALVRACLDRIVEREPVVGAWTHVDPGLALAQARDRDRTEPTGRLHGVPVGVKDIIDTADLPTEYGSPIYHGHRPARDAACVARLRAAGAVILGKTVTTEFALFNPGKTANPHNPSHTPGGSSSGSAAAVADGMVPLALGTQTAGSVVRPASFCGIYGFKPTFDMLDLDGVKPLSEHLDTLGVFARDVEDLGLGAAVLAGSPGPAFDLETADVPERPQIGFVRTHQWLRADAKARAAIARAVEGLREVADVRDLPLPEAFERLPDAQQTVMDRGAAGALAPEHRQHGEQLSASLRDILRRGARITDVAQREALRVGEQCGKVFARLAADFDFLITPSVVGEAPAGLEQTGDPLFCRSWTLLGTPAVSVPGLRGPSGLPLGVQVIADRGQDARALAGARWLGRVWKGEGERQRAGGRGPAVGGG